MLLDNRDPVTSNPSYCIPHPDIRKFASDQLEARQEFEKRARMRWSKYYLDLAARHLTCDELKERYWNALQTHNHKHIDPEWPNLQKVLAWADLQGQDQVLVGLMLLLTHYMCARMHFSARIYYSQKAAEAAIRLGRKEDAALLRIDGSGWILLEEDRLPDAREEITIGLHIAHTLDASSTDRLDLIALANTWLAEIFLEEGKLAEASALMDNIALPECKPIQYRVYLVAGDIAYENKDIAKAKKLYESAYKVSLQYGGEGVGVGVHTRLGDVYLASNDLVQAEKYFSQVLALGQNSAPERIPHAKYGLARLALKKGEREKALQLAQEAWSDLSQTVRFHRLLSEIQDFLQSLKSIS